MTLAFDMERAEREVEWLVKNPEFEERPATIIEFLGPGYLDIENMVRPGIRAALIEIFGEEVTGLNIAKVVRAMVTGGIGIGKTTIASICLAYMCHWVLCLRDPQKFFELMPGSRIAFMMMSTSEDQAREVIFQDVKARIQHSDWFVNNYPYDPAFKKQIRFPKDVWILPGDSSETTFEGYNILGGILDEADSHKVTRDKDYAEDGYTTINSRIESRFGKRGLIVVIGQMKKADGFASRTFDAFQKDPQAYTLRMTIWESRGWERYLKANGERDSFYYDTRRKEILPQAVGAQLASDGNEFVIEVPTEYRTSFQNDPVKALRDLAGIPPAIDDPFISDVHRVELARDKWHERHGAESPVSDSPTKPELAEWFRGDGDPRKRVAHIDLATSPNGDALGLAMGHVDSIVEIDGEEKPYIVIDLLMRMKARPGSEIILGDIRRLLYDLRDERHFKLKIVSYDGFQSTDSLQQLRKKRFTAKHISVDREKLPYEDLRDAIMDERIEFPRYVTYVNIGDTKTEEVLVRELLQLQDTGKKIDHPAKGSKDLADAVAGVCTTLMGDRSFHRRVRSAHSTDDNPAELPLESAGRAPSVSFGAGTPTFSPFGNSGLSGSMPPIGNDLGLTLPPRLGRTGR
jgi:hypothetical protein